ncbi:uncharacterized protein LTR77_001683 [Saxophila tyrrhenica]|uniref:Uncharacterized protein n=1 Tax=Saxophila tyrrhenica TaxID=1690608 RepID=A0AAV9PMT9_9PEZI|nr:hypothetical protein LTR77_001683 [Saxophila tyrrhenica]
MPLRPMRTTRQTDYKPQHSSPLAQFVWHIDDRPSPSPPPSANYGLGLTFRSPRYLPPLRPRFKIKIPKHKRPELERKDASLDPALFEDEARAVDEVTDSGYSLPEEPAEGATETKEGADDFSTCWSSEVGERPGEVSYYEQVQQSIEPGEARLKRQQSREGEETRPEELDTANSNCRDFAYAPPPFSNSYPISRLVVSDQTTDVPHAGAEQASTGGQTALPENSASQIESPQSGIAGSFLLAHEARASTSSPQDAIPTTGAVPIDQGQLVVDDQSWSSDLGHTSDKAGPAPQRVILRAYGPRSRSRVRERALTEEKADEEGQSGLGNDEGTRSASKVDTNAEYQDYADVSGEASSVHLSNSGLMEMAAAALRGDEATRAI